MRKTKQKDLILKIINRSYNHPSAYDIYLDCRKEIPNISLGTVYRNLNTLIESNMIQKIKSTDNIDRYDRNENHSHFICKNCNKIIDIDKRFNFDEYIDGNKVLNCRVILEGLCKDCEGEVK